MKRLRNFALTLTMLLFVTAGFAAAPVQVSYINETTGVAIPVSVANPLPVSGDLSVDSPLAVNVLAMPGISISPDTRFTFLGSNLEVTLPDTHFVVSGTVISAMSDVTVTDTLFDITMSDTTSTFNTGAFPAKTIAYELSTSGGTAFTWAWSSGGITSNYYKQQAGIPLISFQLGPEKLFAGTLYLKGTTAADVMCVHIITKP